ncbi:MAG: SRPBCC domain-containing protein [Planctomycetes bacterium]|nr:SRPBCC domain-containing protein [Planctomycetota bacterium]
MRATFPSEAELKKVIKEYNAVEGGKQTLARLADYLGEKQAGTLVITRLFDAPRKDVWKAWTDPAAFKKWWGPKDFTCPVAKMDLKKGGKYHWCMRGPDGKDYWTTGEFLEVSPMGRLVYTDNFADEKGNVVSPEKYGMTGKWGKMLVTVTLEDNGKRTKMTLKHTGLPAGEMSEMTGAGWNQSFDKLAASL